MQPKANRPAAPAERPTGTEAEEFQIESLDSAEFSAKTFGRAWLIQNILVWGQAGVIGGAKKTLKTTLAVDMAVSIGGGAPFLGEFPVPRRRRVAVLSGESGESTLQETALRVCAAKGVSLADCAVEWSFTLPTLNRKSHRRALGQFLRDRKVRVVFIDPLYLCLLGGGRSVAASNLYEVGPLLWGAARACLDAGATPIFLHHATKTAAKAGGPLDLDDLAFAGIGEFARQWVLLSRREPFQPGVGRHRLRMVAGGSAGHSGCWDLAIDEGTLGDDFTGRDWQVQVAAACAWDAESHNKQGGRKRQRAGGLELT